VVRVYAWSALTLLVVAVGLSRPVAARPPEEPIRLGVLSGMFRDVPPPLVTAAATPFRELFKKQTGRTGDVEVVNDYEELATRMRDKKLHFGVFHGFEWAWVKDRYPELVPLAVTIPPRRPQAALVVKADSKDFTPADLKGECVAVPVATKAHCRLFLERLAETLPAGRCGTKEMPESGPDGVLDAVADGKVQAALLDVGSLKAYQSNQPGRGALIRTLAESEPFPPTVIVYRQDGVGDDIVGKVKAGLVRTKDEASGRAFLFLWKLKGFEEVPASYAGELQSVAKRYPAPGPGMGMMALPE
jgi:ABC-type phosphate/phosphonate transport system substrate-binding protein